MCQGLSARGLNISLAYREEGNLLPQYQEFCSTTIHISQLYRYSLSEPLSFFTAIARLAWLHQRQNWDILYANQYHDLPLPTVLGKVIRRPTVCHLRLPPPSYLSRQYRWGLQRCDRIVANSEYTATQYQWEGIPQEPMRVVHNGIDTEHFVPQDSGNRPMRWLLYLGRITPEKGLDTLLDAYGQLARRRDDIGLRIVGGETQVNAPPEYRENLKKRALRKPGTVEFIPHQEDVRPLLSESDLLVLPSEWGEPFGRVLIEAMSAGVPVVGTRDGGIPEVLGSKFEEHLAPPGDAHQLRKQILRFVDWRDEQPELGASMRKYVKQNFSVEQTVKDMHEVLQEVV